MAVETTVCEYHSPKLCLVDRAHCNKTEVCDPPEPGKRSHCYALWNTSTGVPEVQMKGCWIDNPGCYNHLSCVGVEQKKDQYFCCCEGDNCNSVLTVGSNSNFNRTRKPGATSGIGYIGSFHLANFIEFLFMFDNNDDNDIVFV